MGWISACVVELGLFLILPLCTLWGWFLGAAGLVPAAPAASPPPQLASQNLAVLPSFSSLAPLSLFPLPIAPPLPSLLSVLSHSMCCSFPTCSLLQVFREPASPLWARVEHSTELSFVNMFSKIPVFVVVVCLISSLLCHL